MKDLTEILKIDPNAKYKECKKGDILQIAGSSKTSTF
jgi:DNA-directed RNA polymerase subunit H (RpoH/RPB5)